MKRWATFRRSIALAVIASLATTLVWAGGSPASGQEEFIRGSGRAEGRLLRVGPSAGRLGLAPMVGITLADYLETLGRGESRIADFAALDDSIPKELKDAIPPVRVESTDDSSDEGKAVVTPGTPPESPAQVGGMRQSAVASDTPAGASEFQLATLSIPGVIEVDGAVASAQAGIAGGNTREAVGRVRIGRLRLAGGAVELTGLKWEAIQRTGAKEDATGSFTIEGATIAGEALPIPAGGAELDAVLGPLNEALAPSGLRLDPPVATHANGVARVSSLGIRIVDSQAGRTVLAPVLDGVQPVREPVAQALIDAAPDAKTAILLADVAIGIFSGAGRLDLEVGGAMAFTEGVEYGDPFAGGGGFALADPAPGGDVAPVLDGAPAGGGGAGSDAAGSHGPGAAGADSPGAGAGDGSAADAGTDGSGETAQAAPISTSGGEKGGAALAVGLIGLLAALGLAAFDYQRMRAGARTIPA